MKKSGSGCLGTVILVTAIALAIYFWWVLVIAAVSVIFIYAFVKHHGNKKRKESAAAHQQAKKDVASNVTTSANETRIEPIATVAAKEPVAQMSVSKYRPAPVIHKLRRKLHDYVVFDIETTGLDRSSDEIIQISGVKVRGDEVVDTFNSYVQPSVSIPENITYLTGIDDDTVNGAPSVTDVMNTFGAFTEGLPLVGHNIIRFDIPFIIANGFYQTDIEALDTWRLATKCTFPEELPNLKLATLKLYFGLRTASHNALEDCKTNMLVYTHLRDGKLDRVELPPLPQTLLGLRFGITGEFRGTPRSQIKEYISSRGGRVTTSISRRTDYLLLGKQISDRLIDGVHSTTELKAAELQNDGEKIQIIGLNDLHQLAEK
jgi:DNA polymerase-3 subunit epsilon